MQRVYFLRGKTINLFSFMYRESPLINHKKFFKCALLDLVFEKMSWIRITSQAVVKSLGILHIDTVTSNAWQWIYVLSVCFNSSFKKNTYISIGYKVYRYVKSHAFFELNTQKSTTEVSHAFSICKYNLETPCFKVLSENICLLYWQWITLNNILNMQPSISS